MSRKSPKSKPPFDRSARDALRRRPVQVTQAQDGVTLVGHVIGAHVLVDSRSWQPLTITGRSVFGTAKKRAIEWPTWLRSRKAAA